MSAGASCGPRRCTSVSRGETAPPRSRIDDDGIVVLIPPSSIPAKSAIAEAAVPVARLLGA
jgi:hypothetical protein